ncbi:MAG: NUDIX hydrolase [Bacteroidota bacterium]
MSQSYTYPYPRPMVTVDAVILRPGELETWEILLIERGNPPFAGQWALPGGYLDMKEDLHTGAKRELVEETGLQVERPMTQLGAYGDPKRDPRGRTITIAYGIVLTETESTQAVGGQDDARAAAWHMVDQLPALAFDHAEIIAKGITTLLGR